MKNFTKKFTAVMNKAQNKGNVLKHAATKPTATKSKKNDPTNKAKGAINTQRMVKKSNYPY